MLKKKFVLLGLAIALILTGAAYIYWAGLFYPTYTGTLHRYDCTHAEFGCEELLLQTTDGSYVLDGDDDFKKYADKQVEIRGKKQPDSNMPQFIIVVHHIRELK